MAKKSKEATETSLPAEVGFEDGKAVNDCVKVTAKRTELRRIFGTNKGEEVTVD
jgi:hypothetical protein